MAQVVSIHAAQAGCDLLHTLQPYITMIVSIHAAQAGCDLLKKEHNEREELFQFTQPKRAATSDIDKESQAAEFQFTQPKRAATGDAKQVDEV